MQVGQSFRANVVAENKFIDDINFQLNLEIRHFELPLLL
jgi:hypothetical protein